MTEHKILIVDDDLYVASFIRTTLRASDRSFITASDGVEAVEKVFTEMPDLIILDVMMPKMNGYQVCRLLKNDKTTWQIPVIMLTAKSKEKDKFYAVSVGADAFLMKPFLPVELKDKVDELLKKAGETKKACPVGAPAAAIETNLLSKVNTLLDKKLQEMTFLQHITRSMISTFDEDAIFKVVLSGINSELGYSRVAVFGLDEGGGMTLRDSTGFPEREDKPAVDPISAETVSRLLSLRAPLVLKGAGAHAAPEAAVNDPHAEHIQEALVPIVWREEVRGTILVERQEGEPPFSEERLGVLSTLAGQMGLALDNASLYRTTLVLSITDGLTALYNARYFYSRLETEISRAKRYERPLTLFMLDIDYFKGFNDSYGHLSGDEALRQVARILKDNSRATDTLARYGGEEFAIILPETDKERAVVLAERIRKAIEQGRFDPGGGGEPVQMTISIGVATLNGDVASAEDLVKMADSALYRAKEAGRNKVCCFKP